MYLNNFCVLLWSDRLVNQRLIPGEAGCLQSHAGIISSPGTHTDQSRFLLDLGIMPQ